MIFDYCFDCKTHEFLTEPILGLVFGGVWTPHSLRRELVSTCRSFGLSWFGHLEELMIEHLQVSFKMFGQMGCVKIRWPLLASGILLQRSDASSV